MSYVEQTWTTGDTITAEKLNHMESGIAESGGGRSGAYITTSLVGSIHKVNATYGEIKEMLESGIIPVIGWIAKDDQTDETYIDKYITVTGLISSEGGEGVMFWTLCTDQNVYSYGFDPGELTDYPTEYFG